jgi:type II secretory pathway component HofQ
VSAQGVPQNPQRYTGHPVSLDFSGRRPARGAAHLRRDQRAEHRHRPHHSGHVDVSLRDVPWDQALDIILRANQLGYSSTAPSSASRR